MKENIVIDGKCYYLIQGDNEATAFMTKFYDKPIDTLCVTETDILYIPSEDWIKLDRKSYESLLEAFKVVGYKPSMFNEFVYLAVNRHIKFDADADSDLLKELKASVEFKNYLF